jgi:hypothetical protein
MRTQPVKQTPPRRERWLDTNRCSWSYVSHDEHTFEAGDEEDEPVTVVAPVRPAPSRRRSHTTYRRPGSGTVTFRPGGPLDRGEAVGGPHRVRPVHGRCDDPRSAARAAALRRRHILLALVAVAIMVALAVPWGGRGGNLPTSTGPARVATTVSVRPGERLILP